MAENKLYGVAVATIRNRGFQDIVPGSVFGVAEGDAARKEYYRLLNNTSIREPSDDEVKLYEAKVGDGEIPAIFLGQTEEQHAANVETQTANLGLAAEPVKKEEKDEKSDTKDDGKGTAAKQTGAKAKADDI